jgi:hypothetical protein
MLSGWLWICVRLDYCPATQQTCLNVWDLFSPTCFAHPAMGTQLTRELPVVSGCPTWAMLTGRERHGHPKHQNWWSCKACWKIQQAPWETLDSDHFNKKEIGGACCYIVESMVSCTEEKRRHTDACNFAQIERALAMRSCKTERHFYIKRPPTGRGSFRWLDHSCALARDGEEEENSAGATRTVQTLFFGCWLKICERERTEISKIVSLFSPQDSLVFVPGSTAITQKTSATLFSRKPADFDTTHLWHHWHLEPQTCSLLLLTCFHFTNHKSPK